MPLGTLTVVSTTLDLLLQPDPGASPAVTLQRGDLVTVHAQRQPGWFLVSLAINGGIASGYAPATRLHVSLAGDCGDLPDVNARLWELTMDGIERRVGYHWGAKESGLGAHPPMIDCSGWVAYLLKTGFRWANTVANERVFWDADISALDTYSDAMVDVIWRKTGFMLAGADVVAPVLRSGMVIGVNEGPLPPEVGREPRPRNISHVVLVLTNPATGVQYVTQSTTDRLPQSEGSVIGGPAGVCCVLLKPWLNLAARKPGLYAVDAIRLADAFTDYIGYVVA